MKPRINRSFYGQPRCRDTYYRYWLHRKIGKGKGKVLFIMLNPSDALSLGRPDARADNDKAVARCINIARFHRCRDLTVVNLFAFRSANPESLLYRPDKIIGPYNDAAIKWAIQSVHAAKGKVVCAWGGDFCTLWCRSYYVLQTLRELDIQGYCLGMTKKGHPKHPLRVKKGTTMIPLPRWAYPYA